MCQVYNFFWRGSFQLFKLSNVHYWIIYVITKNGLNEYESEQPSNCARTQKITTFKLFHIKTFLRTTCIGKFSVRQKVHKAKNPTVKSPYDEIFSGKSLITKKIPWQNEISQRQKFYGEKSGHYIEGSRKIYENCLHNSVLLYSIIHFF